MFFYYLTPEILHGLPVELYMLQKAVVVNMMMTLRSACPDGWEASHGQIHAIADGFANPSGVVSSILLTITHSSKSAKLMTRVVFKQDLDFFF